MLPTFHIRSTANAALAEELQTAIDQKTKPLGALGQLEVLARQIGLIQQTTRPVLQQPHVLVFAADHGIAREGVSAYPPEVTAQMVQNFARGGAAINVFCRQNNLRLLVVDAGVNADFETDLPIIAQKLGYGTASFLGEPAMTTAQATEGLRRGAALVRQLRAQGCTVLGLGEMGIGNTTSAAALMHLLTGLPLPDCVGRGTGLSEAGLLRKKAVLEAALARHGYPAEPLAMLATFGGFEIAQLTGAMLAAAEARMVVLVDGFIATAAFLLAHALHPEVRDYAVFCHQSDEAGHRRMLDFLGATPLLHLDLRLGEGTGAALAYPLVLAAVNFLTEMASFEIAGVSNSAP